MTTTLQISLAPGDHRLATQLLPRQIAAWRDQMDEVLLTLDLHRSAGRFADGWEAGRDRLITLIDKLPGCRWTEVDYSAEAQKRVAVEWTGGEPIPHKDFRGGPSYSYFFGLSEAKGRFILHTDADMFFGGLSPTWMREALKLYEEIPDILFLGPLSGPPRSDCRVSSLHCTSDFRARHGLRYDFMSTRLFLIDRQRFKERVHAFKPKRPTIRSIIKAQLEDNPAWDLPEHWMTAGMRRATMCRYEFLGDGDGMWSLHPPYRCEDFYMKLPELLRRVELGDLPIGQLGCHDFDDSVVDWSEARERLKRNRWWRRWISSRFNFPRGYRTTLL